MLPGINFFSRFGLFKMQMSKKREGENEKYSYKRVACFWIWHADFSFRNTVALLKLHPIIDSFINTPVLLKVLLQKVPYLPPDIKSTV